MTYYVEIYCRDCTGVDSMGCFDGGSELLHENKHPWNALTFSDIEVAKNAGWDRTFDCGPWEFFVLDNEHNIIYNSYS